MNRKALLALAMAGALAAPSAQARITRIEITSVESPTFEGRTFGAVGAYEKLRAKGDSRRSLEERYKDHAGYVKAVAREARRLEKRRLLLPADVQRYIDAAEASDVLR